MVFKQVAKKKEKYVKFFLMPYLAHSQIWQNLPTDDSHLGYISKLTQKIIDPHVSCYLLISPSELLKRSARAHVAGNAWLIGPWSNQPAWIDLHIGIIVKTPQNPFKWPY
jgi:hypothetical protein